MIRDAELCARGTSSRVLGRATSSNATMILLNQVSETAVGFHKFRFAKEDCSR